MDTCPCCSEPMLRHTRHGEIYWFCTRCHQEMPNLSSAIALLEHQRTTLGAMRDISKILETV